MLRALKAVAALVFASAIFGAAHSSTLSEDLGTIALGSAAGFSNSPAPGEFDDDFAFMVEENSSIVADVFSVELEGVFEIEGISFALFEDTGSGLVEIIGSASGPAVLYSGLEAGVQYILNVTGSATGEFGGLYAGAIAAVPVPAMLPVLALSLAGLGAIMRRRRSMAGKQALAVA